MLVELTVAMAVVAILAVIVVQLMVWSLRERARIATRHAAVELAANVLEAARAQPIDKLDKTWAESQTIPSDMADLLPAGKLAITVTPAASPVSEGTPVKGTRVTVEVHWQAAPDAPAQSVELSSVFSARSAKKGGTP